MTEQQGPSARDAVLAALRLAKERVTGELDAKKIQRERLSDLIVRVSLYGDNPGAQERPRAADLREVLGIRAIPLQDALEAWAAGDPPAGQPEDRPATDAPGRAAKLGETGIG